MKHHRIRVYDDTRYPTISVTTVLPIGGHLHTTAFVPGRLDGDDYVRTDISHLPQESQDEVNVVWTEAVYTAHEARLRAQ